MEPVTHILTGACLARTGLNRRAAYTTLAMAIGAELPDIDTLWGWRGPVEGFQHHRGITHTFLGLPFEALLIVTGIYGLHCWRLARARKQPQRKPLTLAPARWGLLYLFTLIALLSHLLLDFTNNYGIRPFFPFNPHWYAASIVFIFDPLIFLFLLSALIAPPLFGLVSSEVGARKKPFRGRGWAITALIGIVLLWALRAVEHTRALQLADAQSLTILTNTGLAGVGASSLPTEADALPAPAIQSTYLPALRALANPDPFNPFLWYGATDFGPQYQLSQIDTLHGKIDPSNERLSKPLPTHEVLAASASPLGRVYLDWSSMPLITVNHLEDGFSAAGETIVTLQDLRFLGGPAIMERSQHPPLTGTVELDVHGNLVDMTMDGHVERAAQ